MCRWLRNILLYIFGATSNDGVLEVFAPYDNCLIAEVTADDAAAVEKALQTAYTLYRDRAGRLRPSRRIDILENTVRIMASRAEMLAVEAAREGGNPLVDSQLRNDLSMHGAL